MNKKQAGLLIKLALTAVLTALCFALTYVSVPLPTGAKVHLGNFVCILAGLLLGGIPGGIVGSLGMGLNDIVEGYGWSTVTRTFIVKFFLGFIVGLLFRLLIKRDKAAKITLYSITGLITGSFIYALIGYATGSQVYSYVNEKGKTTKTLVESLITTPVDNVHGHIIKIGNTSKLLEVSVLTPIFLGVIALILITAVVFVLVYKKNNKYLGTAQTAVVTVTAISVIVNTILEFVGRWVLYGIEVSSFEASFVASVTKLPANIITGVVSIVLVALIYLPLYYALIHAGFAKYIFVIPDDANNKAVVVNDTVNNEEIPAEAEANVDETKALDETNNTKNND